MSHVMGPLICVIYYQDVFLKQSSCTKGKHLDNKSHISMDPLHGSYKVRPTLFKIFLFILKL